jgi:uncharacterized protein YcaQ
MHMTETIYDLSAARALALFAQQLTEPDEHNKKPVDKDAIFQTVKNLGCVQIDTLHVVQRSHYLVLWSRLGNFKPGDFDRLVYAASERQLFEGWQHAASIIPIEDYRYQLPRMRNVHQDHLESGKWLSEPGIRELTESVYERIKHEGPLRVRDFEYDGPKRGSWWDWKPAKNALEHLFAWGELMIADRINFQRVYDLRQRVLPEWVNESDPGEEARDRFWLEQGVRALGICQPVQGADYSYGKRNFVKGNLKEMLADGIFVEVKVRVMDGSTKSFLIHRENRGALEKAADGDLQPRRTTFLSPFDSLFWARGRDQDFWNFRNLLEAYKPAPTRVWGYFNMPILHKGNLIGRIDPKIDRKNSRLMVKSIFIEEGVELHEQLIADLAQAFRSFMEFHKAEDIIFENKKDKELGDKLLAEM